MRRRVTALLLCTLALISCSPAVLVAAQQGQEADPVTALAAALLAACRQQESTFAIYLTAEGQRTFETLPQAYRIELMKRFSLLESAGRPTVTDDAQGRKAVVCQTENARVELVAGPARIGENLAFVRLEAGPGRRTEIGLVREGGGWRLLSVGLLLLDLPELAKQWEAAEIQAREATVVSALERLRNALLTYRRTYGRFPGDLRALGPPTSGAAGAGAAGLVEPEYLAERYAGFRIFYRPVRPAGEAAADAPPQTFVLLAAPVDYPRSGRRSFHLTAEGELRGGDKQGALATGADPRIELRRE
jgi:hypothetical protein